MSLAADIARRHAAPIVLGALVIAAGVVAYVDRGAVTTDEARARSRNLCPFFRRDDVTEIRVKSGGRTARVFRGDATDAGQRPWQIELDGGAREPAEESAVDQLLGSLRDGVVVRRVTSLGASERKDFGFDAPVGEVAVKMGDREVRLTFGGARTTVDGSRYVEVDGHEAAVISAALAAAIEVSPDALRRKALITWEASDLDALTLDGAGGPRHLVRAPWRAARGVAFRFDGSTPEGKVRASGAALDAIWDALGHLRADAFLSPTEAESAAKPGVTLVLSPRGAAPLRILIGGECPGHTDDVVALSVAAGAPSKATCVPRGALDALSVPAADLVDRKVVGARADEVSEVTLREGSVILDIARSAGAWHERTPVDRAVDAEVGRAFVERITGVDGTLVNETAFEPVGNTVRVVSGVGGGHEDRTEEIEVGAMPKGEGLVHVRRAEDGAILAISPAEAAALLPDELTLRARRVLDIPTSDFRTLRVVGPLGTQRVARAPTGEWTFVEPALAITPDAGWVADILEAMGQLSAERWIGAARPEQGLDHPRVTVVAEVGDPKSPRRVEVDLGAPVGAGSSFARVAGDPAVFVAPHALEAATTRWLIDRTSLLVDVDRMTRATLTAGAAKLVIERVGAGLQVVGSANPSQAAAAIRDALRALIADGAVSVGPPPAAQGFDKPSLTIAIEEGKRRYELTFGAHDAFAGARVVLGRRSGIDATFAVAETHLRPLLDALR